MDSDFEDEFADELEALGSFEGKFVISSHFQHQSPDALFSLAKLRQIKAAPVHELLAIKARQDVETLLHSTCGSVRTWTTAVDPTPSYKHTHTHTNTNGFTIATPWITECSREEPCPCLASTNFRSDHWEYEVMPGCLNVLVLVSREGQQTLPNARPRTSQLLAPVRSGA